MLETAVENDNEGCTELLCQLAAAEALGSAAVAGLLCAAKKLGRAGCVQLLRSLGEKQQQSKPAGKRARK
jgi:hypothetical protein